MESRRSMSASSSTTSRRARALAPLIWNLRPAGCGASLLGNGPARRSWHWRPGACGRRSVVQAAFDGAHGFEAFVELVDAALLLAHLLRVAVVGFFELALLLQAVGEQA